MKLSASFVKFLFDWLVKISGFLVAFLSDIFRNFVDICCFDWLRCLLLLTLVLSINDRLRIIFVSSLSIWLLLSSTSVVSLVVRERLAAFLAPSISFSFRFDLFSFDSTGVDVVCENRSEYSECLTSCNCLIRLSWSAKEFCSLFSGFLLSLALFRSEALHSLKTRSSTWINSANINIKALKCYWREKISIFFLIKHTWDLNSVQVVMETVLLPYKIE